MAKRLISIIIMSAAGVWALTGCNNSVDTADKTSIPVEQKTSIASDSATAIDWSIMASGESPATLADYKYPFALDSQSVRAYANYFKVDNATAQHNLTVGMASNEALSKILDQLSNSYVSHELTDGKTVELVIHTTPDTKADRYDYVLADDFGKGLILPIVIKPDGKKGDVEGHGGS